MRRLPILLVALVAFPSLAALAAPPAEEVVTLAPLEGVVRAGGLSSPTVGPAAHETCKTGPAGAALCASASISAWTRNCIWHSFGFQVFWKCEFDGEAQAKGRSASTSAVPTPGRAVANFFGGANPYCVFATSCTITRPVEGGVWVGEGEVLTVSWRVSARAETPAFAPALATDTVVHRAECEVAFEQNPVCVVT